ncbi:MAG: glycosyltransferase, partial [Ramlibacter sp.]
HPFEGQFELLQAYARRVAPVQVGWLGCWGNAGGLFDALLADEASVPPGQDGHYEEEVLRLNGGQWCWSPPLSAPVVNAPPVFSGGGITFGVTARSLRLGAVCLDAFARVVAATPRSAIRFIGEVADDWPLRREILKRMQAQGVSPGKVFFDPFVPYAEYLHWFGRVDVVLDSFPGNGGLSMLDPLWMGVPVVTLAGVWAGARQGASVLGTLGLPQWVTDSEEEFCAAAAALAGDSGALSTHRLGLRARILGSTLVDGRRVAAQIEDQCARLKENSAGLVAARDPKARTKAHAQNALETWLALPRTIDLPAMDAGAVPELSVIVVLFNQAGLSRRTLQALADQRGLRFETIIVDNASSDRTPALLEQVRGARIIRNASNLGFLLAARQGAAAASGRRLAFLNSDAILQAGALQATLAAMDADPSIGVLGARVVLTDGGLQEAGNMVFADGSAAGIGRGEDAFGYAARASRATDYVSGVFLVTPAPLWRMLGGFDQAFAPAYYEDTDYCLRVWQAGFRVVYEPSVLLEHLEWGSATGDSATVLMERNRAVFCSRHLHWLKGQPQPQPVPLDGDRWRSPEDRPRLPRVLFLENEVPHMARGGGLPRARLMLQALRDWPVTLFPLWTPQDDWRAIHASLPRTVEVAIDHGLGGLENFLERRRGVYDVLLVSRPPNLHALAPLRARRPELFAGMRLVYDAEALFALREIAMAGVRGRPLPRATAQGLVDAEMALASDAGDVLVVSQRDARYFEAAGLRTHILSHSIAPRRDAPGPVGRTGLLFVGALHAGTPNEDGLLWFIREVMPLLRRRMPVAPVLSVVGVCLSDQVAAAAGPDIHVLGPQPQLEPYYDAARVFIAPVRFAGGVPAKVIEAAAHGIPAVASALLVRQLEWRDGLDILGANDAPAFASAIARLLQDDAAWQRQQHAAWEQCARRYHPDLFGRTLRGVLTQPESVE